MGYALDHCPTLHRCCGALPLRAGVLLIGALGLLWAAAYLFLFSGPGRRALGELGVPAGVGPAMRYVHGVFGVLLGAVHALLLLGAACESEALCEVYVWFLALFWLLQTAAAAVLAVAAALADKLLLAGAMLGLLGATVLASLYSAVVVANYRMTLP